MQNTYKTFVTGDTLPEDQVLNVLKFYSKSISYEKDDITILKDFIDVLTRDECKNFWTKESTRLLLEDLILKIIKSKGMMIFLHKLFTHENLFHHR